jgi:predicted Zn-ribbon and HTH transcriptional regulator
MVTTAEPAYRHTCLRCETVWRSFSKRPAVCPSCKSYVWDKPKK